MDKEERANEENLRKKLSASPCGLDAAAQLVIHRAPLLGFHVPKNSDDDCDDEERSSAAGGKASKFSFFHSPGFVIVVIIMTMRAHSRGKAECFRDKNTQLDFIIKYKLFNTSHDDDEQGEI